MGDKEKEEAKALKKKLKAEAKALKKKMKAEPREAEKTAEKFGKSENTEKASVTSKTFVVQKKSWRDNILLYVIVAIIIAVIAWFLNVFLNSVFGA